MEEETKRKNQRTEKRQEKKRDIEEKERSRDRRGGGMKEGTREKYIEQKRREDICRYEM